MNETAAKLVADVLPVAPYRQWTLAVPRRFRHAIVRDPKFFTAVINICVRQIFAWQKRKARALGITSPKTASVTALQRFGSKINLHPHMHAVVPDGVFADTDSGLCFIELPPPTDQEVEMLCTGIARRIVKKTNAWTGVEELDDDEIALAGAQDEALRLPLPESPPVEPKKRSQCALVSGFSLDANTSCAAGDRAALERLLRYGLRPPFAQSRLKITPTGKVAYRLRRPWFTGQTEIVFSPIAFLKRLTALIPPPRQNQIRFHGLIAPNAKRRNDFVALANEAPPSTVDMPTTAIEEKDKSDFAKKKRIAWAQLLKRVFETDVLVCPDCKGQRKVIAAITEPDAVQKILRHLGIPAEPPTLAPARAPPQPDFYDDGWVPEHTPF